MKTLILKALWLIALLTPVAGFTQVWVWPMAGHKAGEHIASQPGSYIEKEYNCCDLFIEGKAGDVVLCPVNGTVEYVSIEYADKLEGRATFPHDSRLSWDENIARDIKGNDKLNPSFVSGQIRIRIPDGRAVDISGLAGNYTFKEGQKVSAGDTLGLLTGAYKALRKPSLCLSVINEKRILEDPMAPFGLESNFHLEIVEREDPISVEKFREDLTILEKAVLELYPSLNQRMSNEAFHDSMEVLRQSVTQPTSLMYLPQLRWFCHMLNDSHLTLMPDVLECKPRDFYMPPLFYSWVDDTMRVLVAETRYQKYNERVVKSVDGMSPHDFVELGNRYYDLYDNNVQSNIEEKRVMFGKIFLSLYHDSTANGTSHIVFDDGEELDVPFMRYPFMLSAIGSSFANIERWTLLNVDENPDSVYSTRHLNDSTDYLSIKTFFMNEAQLEEILHWIGHCKAANMIIDVRNNRGGDVTVMNRLLACFAQQPMNRQRGGHLHVNKKGNFESLKYSSNHRKDEILFPNYAPVKGKNGYYSFDDEQTTICIMPDSSHQYTGRVYVLTNGQSLSAATIFPAVLVRNRRGVSVGRETGSAYHYITALETAQIVLPNTFRTIVIPMVEAVFDTTVCERLPWGRGLLPDYELPLTYYEVNMGADGETDVMLEYALKLIADGQYLSAEDPFAEIDNPKQTARRWVWLLVVLGAIAVVGITIAAIVLSQRSISPSSRARK